MTTSDRVLFFFKCCGDHRHLHSFPTRRSSDLTTAARRQPNKRGRAPPAAPETAARTCRRPAPERRSTAPKRAGRMRSEEHTSELQSRRDLVCRLLLEKKKQVSRSHVPEQATKH